jgi:hypothetical protein
MSSPWIESVCDQLLCLRGNEAGWGYRREQAPCVEPTALACLAVLGAQRDGPAGHVRAEIERSADWVAAAQRRDGAVGISAAVHAPSWTTPHAILLWAALDGHSPEQERAVRWLLGQEGVAIPLPAASERALGHDTTLVGWPWTDGTHSWLEPTALAVLALRRTGKCDHPRVRQGLRLIRDRAIAGGGWNYGNRAAFGHDLRPQPGPTGLALLALAGTGTPAQAVASGIAYLKTVLPRTRAPLSLCWGVLGLRAWEGWPPESDDWLAAALAETLRREHAGLRLAHLLLAAGPLSLELFGLAQEKEESHGSP